MSAKRLQDDVVKQLNRQLKQASMQAFLASESGKPLKDFFARKDVKKFLTAPKGAGNSSTQPTSANE